MKEKFQEVNEHYEQLTCCHHHLVHANSSLKEITLPHLAMCPDHPLVGWRSMKRDHQIHHHLLHHKTYCCYHLMPANCGRHLEKHSDLGKETPGRLKEEGHHLQLIKAEEEDRHHSGN